MSLTQLKVGDCFLIKGDNGKDTIGRIEEIIPDPTDNIIRYNLFYFPEDTQTGRQTHNSKNEIYKSDETEKEFYSNIKQLIEVIPFDQYMKRRLTPKAKGIYFYRQIYSPQDDTYLPDLDFTCYCDKILNPDEEYIQCSKCKDYFHLQCYLKSESKKCFNELCNNIIENQLQLIANQTNQMTNFNTYKLQSNQSTSALGKKHNREPIEDSSSSFALNQKQETLISNTHANVNLNTNVNNSDNQNEKYSNLPEESRLYLMKEISKIEREDLMLSKTLSEKEKVRQNARDTILFSLLYGIEELKTFNDWTKFKKTNSDLTKEKINDPKAIINYCKLLSMQIENLIYFTNNSEVSQNYKKKLRMLYTHLDNEGNNELRLSILSNEITPKRLIGMTSDELAPSSFIQSRLEQQNKYFKEQVLIEDDSKIITKTYKGGELLSANNDTKAVNFVPFEVPKSNSGIKSGEEDNDDISEKASWDLGSDQEPAEKKTSKKIQGKAKKYDLNQVPNLIKNKYKNLSSEKLKFYFFLEEFRKENIENKINEKIKITLKKETLDELNIMRERFKAKIEF